MIESGDYEASEFVGQIKELVNSVIINVLRDNSGQRIEASLSTGTNKKKK